MSEVDVSKRAAQYVALRDKIKEIEKEHEEALRPYRDAQKQLEGVFATVLSTANVKSMKTEGGTITATERASATVDDMDAFRTHVVNMGDWDLADLRANAPAVRAWAEQNKQLPPGVKLSIMQTISVRRPTTKT